MPLILTELQQGNGGLETLSEARVPGPDHQVHQCKLIPLCHLGSTNGPQEVLCCFYFYWGSLNPLSPRGTGLFRVGFQGDLLASTASGVFGPHKFSIVCLFFSWKWCTLCNRPAPCMGTQRWATVAHLANTAPFLVPRRCFLSEINALKIAQPAFEGSFRTTLSPNWQEKARPKRWGRLQRSKGLGSSVHMFCW